MQTEITKRQKDLLAIIYHYIDSTGYAPTFNEMRESLNVISNQSVINLLKQLQTKGFIKRSESFARSIVILPAGYKVLNVSRMAQILGYASAGRPEESSEVLGEWQEISAEVARLKDEIFLLKISGDSMINAGIDDGDMVVVQVKKEFFSGDIVLAQINNEATIKRFITEKTLTKSFLQPENPKYQAIPCTSETKIIGKVISVLKNGGWRAL